MNETQGLIVAIAIAMVAVAVVVVLRRGRKLNEDAERKRVSRVLRGFAGLRGYKVIDNPVLVSGGISGWADHLLIGYFGVLMVYDLCYGGEYYGELNSEKWTIGSEGKRYAIDNPRLHAGKCEGRIRTLCKNAGLKIAVEQLAVVTVGGKNTIICIKSGEIIKIKKLRGYLDKTRFEEDRGVDIEKVTELLKGAMQ